MQVIEDGIDMSSNDLHELKAENPIWFTDDGITIFFKDEHP